MTLKNSLLFKVVFVGLSLFFWWLAILPSIGSVIAPPESVWNLLSAGGILPFGLSLLGMYWCWVVCTAKVEVDEEGIRRMKGFSRQNARWAEVAAYYWNFDALALVGADGPVLLSADGTELFRGFPVILEAVLAPRDKYTPLREYVITQMKAHLEGKRIEFPQFTAVSWVPSESKDERWSRAERMRRWFFYWGYYALVTGFIFLLHRAHEAKTGPISAWVNHWLFPHGNMEFLANAELLLIMGPPWLAMALTRWNFRKARRRLLPFRFKEAQPLH